ncbi:MAG: polysaccharide pyruvyl transferase family protein [Hyphomicrobiaceae bacterium]|nr:polysaccharide pyruvyl transferase family protein [Hyphomicrobiaceae bacterium]
MSAIFPDSFRAKKLVVGSVGCGPFGNRGNALIERETLRLLGVGADIPKFSIFERLTEELVDHINSFDLLLITGCTTLQDNPDHQICFDDLFRKITIPKINFGAAFCGPTTARPSLRVAEMFDLPIGARDPWTHDYLSRHGIKAELIGCPTLLNGPDLLDWLNGTRQRILVSSTPPLDISHLAADRVENVELISHVAGLPGRDICEEDLFEGVTCVYTGRLHAALPALAQGIRVRFFAPSYGRSRFSLLEFLGVSLRGDSPCIFPATQIAFLKRNCANWIRGVLESVDRDCANGLTAAEHRSDETDRA